MVGWNRVAGAQRAAPHRIIWLMWPCRDQPLAVCRGECSAQRLRQHISLQRTVPAVALAAQVRAPAIALAAGINLHAFVRGADNPRQRPLIRSRVAHDTRPLRHVTPSFGLSCRLRHLLSGSAQIVVTLAALATAFALAAGHHLTPVLVEDKLTLLLLALPLFSL